jgi:ABC-type nitrate/sulfonate/bicarbonate transport system ATPase subunit
LWGKEGFEQTYPKGLSGGMKQRVAIARGLANNPVILLPDDPFGALDAQTRSLMQELLTQVWEELHKTILFVTHDMKEATKAETSFESRRRSKKRKNLMINRSAPKKNAATGAAGQTGKRKKMFLSLAEDYFLSQSPNFISPYQGPSFVFGCVVLF